MAVGLAGCGPREDPRCEPGGLFDPAICPRPEFRVTLEAGLGIGPGGCSVDLTASANGGEEETYAIWGEVVAWVPDPVTQKLREVPHPFGEGADIFGTDRIQKGQLQSGEIDLECFRQNAGEDVWVQLEVRYTVVQRGAPAASDKTFRFELECV
jgi:hypothetical protein